MESGLLSGHHRAARSSPIEHLSAVDEDFHHTCHRVNDASDVGPGAGGDKTGAVVM